ncbi:hypothetical protein [Mesorhizobium sp.]|uniref:hypothetical protein n=1 Tax=Mesorhizobium sp. TaxID=1871066 RepID=UPI0011F524BB|nr:hypothetical protein [Mesorhizobium sp.]TIX28849.1 MAG: hypothetical protein E5V35_00375 [Mesorhizobium sp.]
MSAKSDKQRIIALQKALRLAKAALGKIAPYYRDASVEEALYEIEKLDWNSKPDLVQDQAARAHR